MWKRRSECGLLVLGLWMAGLAAGAHANTFDVFGPETFVRSTGAPGKVVRDFTVAQPTATSYVLHIDNGGANDELPRVTSASVKLNGTVVFKPSDFGQNVRTLEKPVTLTATDKLTIELAGAPGSGFSLRVSGTDNVPPVITATPAPRPNVAGWNLVDVTVIFHCSDALSGIRTCPPALIVSTEGANQQVSGTAIDKAGNTATVTATINLDKTAPALAVATPADGATVFDPQLTVAGTVSDAISGLAAVTCNGQAATFGSGSFTCGLTLALGANSITVEASDQAGNKASVALSVTLADATPEEPPEVHIDAPARGLVSQEDSVAVTGTINGSVSEVSVNGVAASLSGTTFTAADVPLEEGTNRLVATARTSQGAAASDSVSVRRDTQPPLIVIETPRNGERLIAPAVTVSGTVNDIIPGATVNADDVTLTINGAPAAVNNRTFMVADVALALGDNTITAVATDRAGNSRTTSIHVSREPDLAGIRVEIVDGNNQRGPVNSGLPRALKVRLTGPDGEPLPARPVQFAVAKGDGLLDDPGLRLRQKTLLTDDDGEASTTLTLGSRTGEGFHRVHVTTPGSLTFADFCATAEPGGADRISTAFMPLRRGVVGQTAPAPLAVIVTDAKGNGIANLPVTFTVELGGGHFADGNETTTIFTNPDGIAEALFTLGPYPGPEVNRVAATFPGNPGLPADFVLTGLAVGPPAATRISGVVQNTAGEPIVGVEVEVEDVGLETETAADGSFVVFVPPGGHRVAINGSTANDPANDIYYPYIDFAVEAVSGNDNRLDQVVVLPFLDMANAKMVGGDEDEILGMAGVDGFSIKVFAHSTIRHDGTRGPVLMSSSQVKFDKMPMPPPQGSTPFIVGTFQPGGIRFDPPAQVIYPNVNGLAPGDVADIFAFHHDIGQYVNVGPGTVSEDGTVIVSDPGFGFVQSGWHGLIRFPGPTGRAANGCRARLEWRYIRADGSLGSVTTGPVRLIIPDANRRNATVRVLFGPPGGSFDGAWTGGPPIVNLSGPSTSGFITTVSLMATGTTGVTTVTSPTYRFGGGETCQAEVEVHAQNVVIDVNLTTDQTDDLTVFAPPMSTQTVQARVTRLGGSGPIQLSVTPAGNGTLSPTMVNPAIGASATVTFTPAGESAFVNSTMIVAQVGGVEAGSDDMTVVHVELPPHVRRTNTPAAMAADRIPPRIDSIFPIVVRPDLGVSGQTVTLAVNGQNVNNGTVTINAMPTLAVTKSMDIKLQGTAQTAPSAAPGGAFASNLLLVAKVRNQDTVQSPGFSVAAIPENWVDVLVAPVTGPARGIVVQDSWVSDSGVLADLAAAAISELIQVSTETGSLIGLGGGNNSSYLTANSFTTDTHSTGVASITGPGTQRIFQTSMFRDYRTGAVDIPMTNSGYIIDRTAFVDAAGVLMFTTAKFGAAVTANGIASGAGQPVSPPISVTQVR